MGCRGYRVRIYFTDWFQVDPDLLEDPAIRGIPGAMHTDVAEAWA